MDKIEIPTNSSSDAEPRTNTYGLVEGKLPIVSAHALMYITCYGEELADRSSEFETLITEFREDLKDMKIIEIIRTSDPVYNLRSTLVHILSDIKSLGHRRANLLLKFLKDGLSELNGRDITGLGEICYPEINDKLHGVLINSKPNSTSFTKYVRTTK